MNDSEYIVTLDNGKKYALISAMEYDGKKYAYLSEMDDCTKYMIGEVIEDSFNEVIDQKLLGDLLSEFNKNW